MCYNLKELTSDTLTLKSRVRNPDVMRTVLQELYMDIHLNLYCMDMVFITMNHCWGGFNLISYFIIIAVFSVTSHSLLILFSFLQTTPFQ